MSYYPHMINSRERDIMKKVSQLTEKVGVLGKSGVVYEHLLSFGPRRLEGDIGHAVQDLAQHLE